LDVRGWSPGTIQEGGPPSNYCESDPFNTRVSAMTASSLPSLLA
jgi:hypothetical protein